MNSFKILVVAFFAFVGLQHSNAQVTFVPKVGVNLSALDFETSGNNIEGRAGFHVGADARIGQGKIFFNPGVFYQSFTAKLLNTSSSTDLKDETTIQFLKIPVNVGWRITGDKGLVKLNLHGGLVPNVLLGVNEKKIFGFTKEIIEPFNLGANIGLGVDISAVTVDVQWEAGLTDFYKYLEGGNNVLSVTVGLVL